jgi:thioredoxin 1
MVHDLTKKNVAELIENQSKPVIVDVFAAWCGPCTQMKPIFKQLATELAHSHLFAQLNVDEERDLAIQYSVTSIPTFLFIRKNAIVGRETGYMTRDDLKAKITEYLG